MYHNRTMIWGDEAPQDEREIAAWLANRAAVPGIETFGVVDRENLTRHPGEPMPLVGVLFVEPSGPENVYAHVTSSRRAWGNRLVQPGMIEQASTLVMDHVFARKPALQRFSVAVFANNFPAQNLAKRMGFRQDGYFRAMASWRGEPMDVVHYGRLRAVAAEQPQDGNEREALEVA